MPIYEYECKQCSRRFEHLQKSSDAPLEICPSCKTESLTKLVSSASFQLKGTGWYATDFKDKKNEDKKSDDKKPVEPQTTPVKDDSAKSEATKTQQNKCEKK